MSSEGIVHTTTNLELEISYINLYSVSQKSQEAKSLEGWYMFLILTPEMLRQEEVQVQIHRKFDAGINYINCYNKIKNKTKIK